eukprot:10588993-Alexandrium_andersonii.AAC.1
MSASIRRLVRPPAPPVAPPGRSLHQRQRCFRTALDSLRTASGQRPDSLWTAAGPVSYTHLTLPTICSV